MNDDQLNGLRVLVVEDEAAISMLLEDMLMDFGCAIVGPAARLNVALDMAQSEVFDVAILDVNLAGESIYPVADALAERKRPFVFSTGYGGAGIKDPYRDRPVVQKPFSQQDLRRTILNALRIEPGAKTRLTDIDPRDASRLGEEESARAAIAEDAAAIDKLQDRLY